MQTLRSIHSVSIHSVRWLLLAIVMMFIPAASFGQVVGISITVAPPALPVYVQPVCPGENYIWTPGYWAYSDDDEDYYWVPGTWVLVPTLASCGHPVIGGGTTECAAEPKAQPQHEAAPRPQPQHATAPKAQPQQHEAAPRPQPQHEAAPKAQSKPEERPKP